ncbi:hypothetical protein C0Q70_07099 [Pomacea canaliculata]|uniref:DEP domain-containing protein n=1 Tax=Pomacea canaliculata TaxID=400727 RepID=A0A2T7PE36_POMCA|nr:hypothetical protein C0Q70_07099 [Pomacea canaliculata]
MSKTCKLWVHRNTKSQQDIIIPPKDFPGVMIGDVLEIYHPEEEFSRLLLQVDSLPEDFQQKDTISIDQSIANTFKLRAYQDVVVTKTEPQNVALDMVELLFKEQYFNRSDMWRLVNSVKNTCVYLNKKIEFSEMRCQVNEMWSKGDKVTCGVITEDTRVVYRSSTAVVQIFIQMSSEMWEFDLNGDLYFEKAVNGFLTDLFAKWKEQNCCHDVTIVLFSRTCYSSTSLDDFPSDIRECLQVDDFGNIYEDYYRVIVQNERYEEWNNTLRLLRKLFNEYPERVLRYHQNQWPKWKFPAARISTASQGNFLETLNMSLNLFENYYLDRNFDRTGKVSVVITPGPGVFEVDRELTFITKQRTIDCGVGSDLVCMGEQPLHAVPLFKFRSKNSQNSVEVGDDYNIPHWMNHSFYTSKSQIQNQQSAKFIPRIKPPPEFVKFLLKTEGREDNNFPFVDYDEYDAQVFKLPSRMFQRTSRSASCFTSRLAAKHHTFAEARRMCGPRTRHVSDDFMGVTVDSSDKKTKMSSSAIAIPSTLTSPDTSYSVGCYPIYEKHISQESFDSWGSDDIPFPRPVVGSAGSPVGHSRPSGGFPPNRALINPFAPSRLQFKMTSNRRRWVHALPTDAKGLTVQPHHVNSTLTSVSQEAEEYTWSIPTPEVVQAAQLAAVSRANKSLNFGLNIDSPDTGQASHSDSDSTSNTFSKLTSWTSSGVSIAGTQRSMSVMQKIFNQSKDKHIPWAPTGDQEWTPDLTTVAGWDWRPLDQREVSSTESRLVKPIFTAGLDSDNFCQGISVDWKSLTMPACLPITTDYFPESGSLQYDYVFADYSLLPDDINADQLYDKNLKFYRRPPLTTHEVFRELISQRLGQGFQLIVSKKNGKKSDTPSVAKSQQFQHVTGMMQARQKEDSEEEYYLSIGRIFHNLHLKGSTITVTKSWPRHPQPKRTYTYFYRFQAPDSYCYDASSTEFFNEQLENYNWSYLDQYICTRGEADHGLADFLKYWRSRFFLLPSNNTATKKIIDGQSSRCDIYEEKTPAELKQLTMSFVRFCEVLNKLKRLPQSRRTKVMSSNAKGFSKVIYMGASSILSKVFVVWACSKEKEDRLTQSSPSSKIVEAMLDPQTGLSFIQGQPGLPGNTFISAEAVAWCQQHVSGAQTTAQATMVIQRLVDDQLVLHASGNPRHMFIYGFYLYYVTQGRGKTEPHTVYPGYGYNTLFQNEWLEVSILPEPDEEETDTEKACKFFLPASRETPERIMSSTPPSVLFSEDWRKQTGLSNQGWGQQSGKINVCANKATLLHKYVNVDVNPSGKSDRQEWASACYNAYYSPLCAFEIQIQWMVATGCILGETIYSWARKAGPCGFHLIPVPVDPFALPNCVNSDPLRSPIFVPLAVDDVEDSESIFTDCSSEVRQERLLLIQDTILKRYGFVRINVPVPDPGKTDNSSSKSLSSQHLYMQEYVHQYVHCTAGMFVLIPDLYPSLLSNAHGPARYPPSPTVSYVAKKSTSDMHKNYIARQQSSQKMIQNHHVGFLWSWNFMSSKRWRSGSTGDEAFQDKMLADFREFCQNKDGRLEAFLKDFSLKV